MAGSAVAATLLAQRPPEQRQLCIQHRPVANSAACAAASAAQPQHIQLQTCPKQSRAHPPRAAGTLRKQQDAGRGLLQRDQLQWEAPTTPPPPRAQPPPRRRASQNDLSVASRARGDREGAVGLGGQERDTVKVNGLWLPVLSRQSPTHLGPASELSPPIPHQQLSRHTVVSSLWRLSGRWRGGGTDGEGGWATRA